MMHRYTDEQIEFIRKIASGTHVSEITAQVNAKFELNVTEKSIKGVMYRKRIKNGMQGHATRFQKGHATWSKGKKGLRFKGSEKGWFQKGQKAHNAFPIGSVRTSAEGRTKIKIAPDKWVLYHMYLYETYKGHVPKGHIVMFADGDRTNFDLDNLVLVKRSVLVAASRRKMLYKNKETFRSGLLLAELLMSANQRVLKAKK